MKHFTDAQLDRLLLLQERRLQQITRKLRLLEAAHGQPSEPIEVEHRDPQIGDTVEIYGVHYTLIGFNPDTGNAQLAKINT